MNAHNKNVFIKTYGCQMNVYDTTRMLDSLAGEGFVEVKQPDDADLIVLNTCHIREKAVEKIYSELGRIRKIKDQAQAEGKQVMIGVAGCVAQAEGEEIIARAPIVDMVFGPQSYHKLPQIVARAAQGEQVVETNFPPEEKFQAMPLAQSKQIVQRGPTAFLTVQEGCDKFCTFCVVPYTRGAEFSRSVNELMAEAQHLVEAGVKEITLLGQNVNAYHGEGLNGEICDLAGLIYHLSDIPGLMRIRYTTSHPRDMNEGLINAHADCPKLMPYIHLPVQSGSNRILKAMNRQHDRDTYKRIIEDIRQKCPDIALSGDFIVGFPGETDQDFEDTLDLVQEVKYAQAYSFKYSPRPGTPGAKLADQIEEAVKSERLSRLQDLLNQQQIEFNQNCVGKTFDILLEKYGKKPGQLVGRSPYLQAVLLENSSSGSSLAFGDMVSVEIIQAGANSLFAQISNS